MQVRVLGTNHVPTLYHSGSCVEVSRSESTATSRRRRGIALRRRPVRHRWATAHRPVAGSVSEEGAALREEGVTARDTRAARREERAARRRGRVALRGGRAALPGGECSCVTCPGTSERSLRIDRPFSSGIAHRTHSTPTTSNRAPPSSLSVTATSHPWASATSATMLRPKPVPSSAVE